MPTREPGALREVGLRAPDDPTVPGARLLPEGTEDANGWGAEPGGGIRSLVGGIRLVSMPDGSVIAAADRLPGTPSSVVGLPDRLGGGFLFALTTRMWRAASWLAPLRPFATSPVPIAQILVGLDRMYVRSPQGSLVAFDPTTASALALGPLPATPHVGRLAAFDGWRAVAVADLQGVLLTVDAGATWRPVALPVDPVDVVHLGEAIAVGGLDEARQTEWWEVRPDGATARMSSSPPSGSERSAAAVAAGSRSSRVFGPRPLASAIEDGWPLTDGTAMVARDGALARVRLSDGALVEVVADAFPLRPARCHAISLARRDDPGAFGFACGEPHGRTAAYRWNAGTARLVELRRFPEPRELLAFANGAVAARGPCEGPPGDELDPAGAPWCVMSPSGAWREVRVGASERIVVLADGRIAGIRPPAPGGDLLAASLVLRDGPRLTERPLSFSPLAEDVARALSLGVWMDGFEERRPGVVGGWVDSAGALLGIEVALGGDVRVGEYIRDAGAPVAAGRWAFGWTASRRGFETTDGGMTWTKEIALPDPIASGRDIRERACGPVGCIAAGWLRVGWGGAGQVVTPEPPPFVKRSPARHPANLVLDCDPAPPGGGAGASSSSSPSGSPATASRPAATAGSGGASWTGSSAFPPFGAHAPPQIPADHLGFTVEASNGLERALHAVPLAQVYTWGPKGGDWDPLGRWQVRWQWPWGGGADLRSSTAAPSPWTSAEGARRALSRGMGGTNAANLWALAEGDDPDHALLLARHTMSPATTDIAVLETDRGPLFVRRPDDEPFAEVEGAVRVGGRWYVATAQSPGEFASTVLWSIEGGVARELTHLPRAGFESRPALRLARHSGGRSLGVVVDGQLDPLTGITERWVTGVDLASGAASAPRPLAPIDFADRPVTACTGGDGDGWVVDLPYPGSVRARFGAHADDVPLRSVVVRMKVSDERVCVDGVVGVLDGDAPTPDFTAFTSLAPRTTRDRARTIDASVLASKVRLGLRCSVR